jgi:glycosyltransferase involved in cell wall biosynthesis
MKFSIITPSLNQLLYLKRCIASVADQSGMEIEHIVIDGGSTDGTVGFLQQYTGDQLSFISEADGGMYEALNKGFDRASGEICAWLNCDEQLLPGTLTFVRDWFSVRPAKDLLSGGALLIRPDGSLLASRKAYPLRRCYISAAHLYNLSCGMFFRSRVWDRGIRFDSSFRNLGDQDWVERLLQTGIQVGYTGRFLSVFCFTGQNLSRNENSRIEEQELSGGYPAWIRGLLNLLRRLEKAMHGGYSRRPVDYAVYSDEQASVRQRFHVEKPSFKWPVQ